MRLVVSGASDRGLVIDIESLGSTSADVINVEGADDALRLIDLTSPEVVVLTGEEAQAAMRAAREIGARSPTTRIVVVHGDSDLPEELLERAHVVSAETMSPARVAAEISSVLSAAKRAAATVLPENLQSAGRARQLVRRAANAWGVGGASDTLALLSTELVANAVRHTGSCVDVTIRLLEQSLRVEVRDRSTKTPSVGQLVSEDESGRGLALVEELASDWGVGVEREGKCVWFEVELEDQT